MKVRELIGILSDMPGDAEVFVADEVCGWSDDVAAGLVRTVTVYDPIEETQTDHHDVVAIF